MKRRNLNSAARLALNLALVGTIASVIVGCSTRPGDSGRGRWTDWGRDGEFEYNNSPKNPNDPNKPGPYAVPLDPYCYAGTCYEMFDTDGDGIPDWAYDPKTRKWYRWMPEVRALMDGGMPDYLSAPPPDDWTAEEMLDFHAVPVSSDPDFGAATISAMWDLGQGEDGWIDVMLHIRGGYSVDCPDNYDTDDHDLVWEIFEVAGPDPDSNNDDYLCVHTLGAPLQVAGWMLDMGFYAIDTQPDSNGVSHLIELDRATRAIFIDGMFVDFAPRGASRLGDTDSGARVQPVEVRRR